ncbi:MAG TPA: isoamylase early set domain-containing protein [Nitrolancea sp.]|jgi:1,4-alpha-glucan branching enzyme|nr:isoamylase early set domain-containing protein [Nitrolancea sp.]
MLTKEYTKTGRSCRVTFELPAEVDATNVWLVGDFNGWERGSTPMKRRKDGSFSTTISLKPGNQYRFRYVLDGDRWENDHAADRYLPNDHGSEDSVVDV